MCLSAHISGVERVRWWSGAARARFQYVVSHNTYCTPIMADPHGNAAPQQPTSQQPTSGDQSSVASHLARVSRHVASPTPSITRWSFGQCAVVSNLLNTSEPLLSSIGANEINV